MTVSKEQQREEDFFDHERMKNEDVIREIDDDVNDRISRDLAVLKELKECNPLYFKKIVIEATGQKISLSAMLKRYLLTLPLDVYNRLHEILEREKSNIDTIFQEEQAHEDLKQENIAEILDYFSVIDNVCLSRLLQSIMRLRSIDHVILSQYTGKDIAQFNSILKKVVSFVNGIDTVVERNCNAKTDGAIVGDVLSIPHFENQSQLENALKKLFEVKQKKAWYKEVVNIVNLLERNHPKMGTADIGSHNVLRNAEFLVGYGARDEENLLIFGDTVNMSGFNSDAVDRLFDKIDSYIAHNKNYNELLGYKPELVRLLHNIKTLNMQYKPIHLENDTSTTKKRVTVSSSSDKLNGSAMAVNARSARNSGLEKSESKSEFHARIAEEVEGQGDM